MSDFLEFARDTAREADILLLDWFEGELTLQTKSSEFDIVTEADQGAERLILERIRERFPEHGVLAEESGDQLSASAYRWLVDPLDGTTNFASALPHFSVSIALQYDDEVIVGAIYDPVRDELFWAERGGGAWLKTPRAEARRLRVSSEESLAGSILATGFSYSRATTESNNLAEFQRLVLRIRGIRRAGSAALDLAYVAAGRLDGYWEYHMQPWDTAAGSLMVEEAGGVLKRVDGGSWDPWQISTVAAGPALMPRLLAALQGRDEG